jgi:hypothetical protein
LVTAWYQTLITARSSLLTTPPVSFITTARGEQHLSHRLKHAPALHLLGADPLDLRWSDRVPARRTGCVLSGEDSGAVDLAHRVILTCAINEDENDLDEMEAQAGRIGA